MTGEGARPVSGVAAETIDRVETVAELARLLRDLRRRDARRRGTREATYRELAAKTGWSHAVIGEYLTGKTLAPTGRFDVLVQVLGATPAELRLLATARDRVEERQRGSAGPPPPATGGPLRLGGPAVVGRRSELAALRARVDGAARGYGGAVFLAGEAGMGKTRLAVEAGRMAAQAGLRVLRGRCATPAVQFRPLSEALLSVLRRSGPPEDPELLPYRPALARLVPEWRPAGRAGADESLVVLAEAMLRLIIALGRPRGCLLVIEDLHEADADTLGVIDYLVDNVAQEPVLLLGTVRTDPSAGLELARAAERRRAATVLELARLDDEAVAQLAGGCLEVPADQVPGPVLDRLLRTGDGIPLHVEELLAGMVSDGVLARSGSRWTLSGPVPDQLPVSLAATLAGRAERLHRNTRAVLAAAALLGLQFPARVAGAAVGVLGMDLLESLREAVQAQLVVPDADPDTYAFRHVLTAEALRSRLLPLERAELSRCVARALEESALGQPDGWERLAGELWAAAGESRRAAELLGLAGRRASAQGAVSTGISLLERALSMVDGQPLDELGTDLIVALVDAYADAGRVADAYTLGARADGIAAPDRRAALHLLLARVAAAAGHWEQGLRELVEVRHLLGPNPGPAMSARIDAVAARLTFGNPTTGRRTDAERLARRALRAALDSDQPDVACSALETLGRCVRLRDLAEADALYARGLAIAEEHNLTGRRIGLLYQIGVHDGIRAADTTRLAQARAVAYEAGAVGSALNVELEIAVVQTCRGEYPAAEAAAQRCEETASRLKLTHTRLLALGLRVMVAAHQGRVSEVDTLMARFRDLGGEEDDFASAVRGFGLAFCHLLHEDPGRAMAELRGAAEHESTRPASYVSLVHGPHLFLCVLAGDCGADRCAELAGSAQVQAAWNRQFLELAEAVLHGRGGRRTQAEAAVSHFLDLSRPYPLARHLGLRLAAPDAIAHGWGDPVSWLRMADGYFHDAAPAVARACRLLLRQAGAPVPQHREGSAALPAPVRERGITVREYEVLRLLGERLGNQEIAQRLFLSPRTVEKHVANLLAKTGRADRAGLAEFAARLDPAAGS